MTIWAQLLVISGGNVVFFALQVWFFHWRSRAGVPAELRKEIRQVQNDIVALRGQVKYLEGRMNGKHWREA
jgi:hypothetical protein